MSRLPFIPPAHESATNIGIRKAAGPYSLLANVYNTQLHSYILFVTRFSKSDHWHTLYSLRMCFIFNDHIFVDCHDWRCANSIKLRAFVMLCGKDAQFHGCWLSNGIVQYDARQSDQYKVVFISRDYKASTALCRKSINAAYNYVH